MDQSSKLNERLTLIANLSVVVGIIFLAVELRQNTQAIQAQTRDSIAEQEMTYLGWRATSPELAAIDARLWSGDSYQDLSPVERRHWSAYWAGRLRQWENTFFQYERGLFTEANLDARMERWRRLLSASPDSEAYRYLWSVTREQFAPSFRAEIDRIVAEVGG